MPATSPVVLPTDVPPTVVLPTVVLPPARTGRPAEAGARKPEPGIFAAALSEADCRPAEALHVGDTPEEDLAGARAAGIRCLLIDRDGKADIAALTEVVDRV